MMNMIMSILLNTCVIFVGAILACVTACKCQDVEFVTLNRENIFVYEGSVNVIAQAPWDQVHLKPPQLAGWKIRGTVKVQRPTEHTFAASVSVSTFIKINAIQNAITINQTKCHSYHNNKIHRNL